MRFTRDESPDLSLGVRGSRCRLPARGRTRGVEDAGTDEYRSPKLWRGVCRGCGEAG